MFCGAAVLEPTRILIDHCKLYLLSVVLNEIITIISRVLLRKFIVTL